MSYEYIAYGTTRTRVEKLKTGHQIRLYKGVYIIKEPSVVDVIETFTKSDYRDYWEARPQWHTIRPENTDLPVKEPKPSLWSRLWAWVRRKPLPQARLVRR